MGYTFTLMSNKNESIKPLYAKATLNASSLERAIEHFSSINKCSVEEYEIDESVNACTLWLIMYEGKNQLRYEVEW